MQKFKILEGQLSENYGYFVLLETRPYNNYDSEGKSTGKGGYKYRVASVAHLTQYDVKVPLSYDSKPVVTNEEIENALADGSRTFVAFSNLTGQWYSFNGKQGVSCTADGVSIVTGSMEL